MRSVMTRLAAVVLIAMIASPAMIPCRAGLTPPPTLRSDQDGGMGAPPAPVVSPVIAPAQMMLGGSPSILPSAFASSRPAFGDRLPETTVRPAFVVKSAPTILRV